MVIDLPEHATANQITLSLSAFYKNNEEATEKMIVRFITALRMKIMRSAPQVLREP